MRTKVVLTVDTEPSIAGAFEDIKAFCPLIDEPVAGLVDGKSEALGFLIDTLKLNQLVATFFVETVHTTYFKNSPMEKYVVQLLDACQDVQLHLHPCWRNFDRITFDSEDLLTDNCSELNTSELTKLMLSGADQLERWTGSRPDSMRPGNYSTGKNVFDAMATAGIKFSSCINIAVATPVEPELEVTYGQHCFSGINELPVTCFRDKGPVGRNRWRPFQITALSSIEMISLLNQAHSAKHSSVVIVTHPFEFLKKDNVQYKNIKANRMVQTRFKRLCKFLNNNRDKFDVVPLNVAGCAETQLVPSKVSDLVGNSLFSVGRAVANFSNDRIF